MEISWKTFAKNNGWKIVSESIFDPYVLEGEYKNRALELVSVHTGRYKFTMLTAAFKNRNNLVFELTPSSFGVEVFEFFFPPSNVKTGDSEFDVIYRIESSHKEIAGSLFTNPELRDLTRKCSPGILKIENPIFKNGVAPEGKLSKLICQVGRVVDDPTELESMLNLVKKTLDELEKIGVAE